MRPFISLCDQFDEGLCPSGASCILRCLIYKVQPLSLCFKRVFSVSHARPFVKHFFQKFSDRPARRVPHTNFHILPHRPGFVNPFFRGFLPPGDFGLMRTLAFYHRASGLSRTFFKFLRQPSAPGSWEPAHYTTTLRLCQQLFPCRLSARLIYQSSTALSTPFFHFLKITS